MHDNQLAFVCSPYRGDKERNMTYVRELLTYAINAGYVPIAPHLLYTQVLNDDVPEERKIGINLCEELIRKSDIVIIGKKYGLSLGMKREIILAKKLGKRILWVD